MERSLRRACCTNTPCGAGLPVIEVLVFAGERNVAAPWLNNQKKATVREAEFRLECSVLGAESVFWDLEAYRMPGYQPTVSDVEKVVAWFETRRPGAMIVPPASDAHVAHRVTRALAAIGMVGSRLNDCLVLTGWTPWGPLPQPNAYLTYDGEAERTKEWAIHCHASQVFLTDYTQYCSHLGRAYAALARSGPRVTAYRAEPIAPMIDSSASSCSRSTSTIPDASRPILPTRFRLPWAF